MGHIMISVSFDEDDDRDILRFLAQQETGKRSEVIREAIREKMGRGGVSLGDVYQAVKAVERKLEDGGWRVEGGEGSEGGEWDEPAEAAAALAKLGRD